MEYKIKQLILFVTLAVILYAAFSWKIGFGVLFRPQGIPIVISVNSLGELEVSPDTQLASWWTPIGIFEFNLLSSREIHEKLGISNSLTLRFNGHDHIFDLGENTIETIRFAPGYYSAIELSIREGDVLVVLVPQSVLNFSPGRGVQGGGNLLRVLLGLDARQLPSHQKMSKG